MAATAYHHRWLPSMRLAKHRGVVVGQAIIGDPERFTRFGIDSTKVVPRICLAAWITQITRLYGDQCVSVKDGFILLVERPPRRRIPGSAPYNAAIRRTANNMPTRVGKPDVCPIGDRSRCTGIRKSIGVRTLLFRREVDRPKNLAGACVCCMPDNSSAILARACIPKWLHGGEVEAVTIFGDARLPCLRKLGFEQNIAIFRYTPAMRSALPRRPASIRSTSLRPLSHV